ncbi:hypothetical protein IWW48_006383, partial [Coemansia sp. RSA 1200]
GRPEALKAMKKQLQLDTNTKPAAPFKARIVLPTTPQTKSDKPEGRLYEANKVTSQAPAPAVKDVSDIGHQPIPTPGAGEPGGSAVEIMDYEDEPDPGALDPGI